MRIAFISYELPPDTGKGGIGTYTSQVANMLSKIGWEVHVFAGSPYHSQKIEEDNIIIHRIQCLGPIDFNRLLVPVFINEHTLHPFDMMECSEIHAHAKVLKEAFPQLPLVVRLHAPNCLVERMKQLYLPLHAKLRYVLGALRRGSLDMGYWRPYDYHADDERAFALMADGITAPSASMRRWAIINWQLKQDSIRILPNPFHSPPTLLNLPILKEGSPAHILFFGRLNVLKGLVNASQAIKKIIQEYPECRFTVIGDDGPGPGLNKTMRQWMTGLFSRVKSRVTFIDGLPYEDLPTAIANAGICVLPSLFESFSYTCAEAMAAGKVVVGSKETGMEDMLQHLNNGMLVDARKAEEIYDALKRLLADDALRYRLAVNARTFISKQYSVVNLANIYGDYYKEQTMANG